MSQSIFFERLESAKASLRFPVLLGKAKGIKRRLRTAMPQIPKPSRLVQRLRAVSARGKPTAPTLPVRREPVLLHADVWLIIFNYLDCEDLRSLSRTSRVLRLMARPLAYRRVTLFTYDDCYSPLTPSQERQVLGRINFYSSEQVAPNVHEVSFYFAPEPNEAVVDAVFNSLPKYYNATSFLFFGVEFTAKQIEVVGALTQLVSLGLHSCQLSASKIPRLPARVLALTGEASPSWLTCIDPDRIEDLRILSDHDGECPPASSEPYPRLRCLNVKDHIAAQPFFANLLCRAPALEHLGILAAVGQGHAVPLPEASLPALRAFSGPDYLSVAFTASEQLVSLSLWKTMDRGDRLNDGLCDVLRELHGTKGRLAKLVLHTDFVTSVLLETLATFECLAALELHEHEESCGEDGLQTREAFIGCLTSSTLPQSTRTVTITTVRDPQQKARDQSQDEQRLDSWARRHPHLEDAVVTLPRLSWCLHREGARR